MSSLIDLGVLTGAYGCLSHLPLALLFTASEWSNFDLGIQNGADCCLSHLLLALSFIVCKWPN